MSLAFMGFSGLRSCNECYLDCRCRREPAGPAFGAILGYASRRFAVEDDPVVEKIDEILPQSQCGQCGYPGCRPYAEAISCNGEKINRCAPVAKL